MWVDLLHGLLWALTLIAVVFTFYLARRIRRHSTMPIERLFVMTFGILIGIAALFYFLNKQLTTSGPEGGRGVAKMEHHGFVQSVYPPLIAAQNKLSHQINRLHDLQKEVVNLRGDHPQQSDRLEYAYNQWLNERKELVQLKLQLDRSVRSAWIQHKTQNKKAIASEFNRQAVDWEKIITDRLERIQGSQLRVSNAMVDNVILQNRNLSRLRRGKNANFATSGAVFKSGFSNKTSKALLEYYEKTAPDSASYFSRLGELINTSSQKGREVRNYSLENPDLKPTLDKVTADWLQLENKAIYYRDQILHALQSHYLAVLLGTNKRDSQLVRLSKSLKSKIPVIVDELEKAQVSLEKSYQTGPR